jgi:hypothetical protein
MSSALAALRIEYWPAERLVEYPRNPRKNDAAVDQMVASIRAFGFAIPVLARSSGEVIDGHLRLKAARKIGSWVGDWRVVWLGGWTRDRLINLVMAVKIPAPPPKPACKTTMSGPIARPSKGDERVPWSV